MAWYAVTLLLLPQYIIDPFRTFSASPRGGQLLDTAATLNPPPLQLQTLAALMAVPKGDLMAPTAALGHTKLAV